MIVIIRKRFITIFIALIMILIIISLGTIIYNKNNVRSITTNYDMKIKPFERGNASSSCIAFACNVDWGNEVIPEMLEIFKEKDIKITFFVTGKWANNFPELFKTIIEEGHEIGSHGYQHLDYGKLTLEENIQQIIKAEEEIIKYTGVKPTLFAPPSGAYNKYTLRAAEELDYKVILWSIDTIDWRQDSTKDVILNRVLSKSNYEGAILLMHPMPETVKALPQIIDELQQKNLMIGRVSDVLLD